MMPPATSRVDVNVTCTTVTVRRHADDLGGALFAVVQNTAALARIGVALPAEGDRWHFVLGGYFGDAATRTRDGVRTFARTLPDRAISDLLANDWLGEPASSRFPFSRRQHWERAARLPPGLVVVGDAVASFNPLYGQGMSSAALQAEALGALLDRVGNSPRLPHAFAKATAAVVANPWQIATGADLVYAQTRGPKGRGYGPAQPLPGTGPGRCCGGPDHQPRTVTRSATARAAGHPAPPAILWRVLTGVRSPRSGPADRSAPTNRADQGQTLDQPPAAGSRLVTRGSATGSRGPASSG